MSTNFQKTSSKIFLTVFIGIIIIAFIVSGPFNDNVAPNSVGAVGGHSISMREFQTEVNRQSEFYSRYFKGGQPLTSNEMTQYRVFENSVRSLSMQKLRLILAEEVNLTVAQDAVKEEIKRAPYFQTENSFDINRYKALLAANQLTPEMFEEDTLNRLRDQKLQKLMSSTNISDSLKNTINQLYGEKRSTTIITLDNEGLKKTLKIDNKEISDYLAVEVNKKRVEASFNQRKAALDKKEQIYARHILVEVKDGDEASAIKKVNKIKKEVNAKNFISLAKKYTDEAQGKENGGDLNWVTKGQMVPEFETALFKMKVGEVSEPIKTQFGYHIIFAEKKQEAKEAKFEEYMNQIATEMIQKEKDVKELVVSAKEEIQKSLGNKKAIEALKTKYNLKIEENIVVNKLEGFGPNYNIDSGIVKDIFTKDSGNYTSDQGIKTIFISSSKAQSDVKAYDFESLQNMISNQTLKTIIDELGEKYPFKKNSQARLNF